MKKMLIVVGMMLLGCAEENVIEQDLSLIGKWDAIWKMETHEVEGVLTFVDLNIGFFEVEGSDDSYLVHEKVKADFIWEKAGSNLNIKRLDNGVNLHYEVLKEGHDNVKMAYTNDVSLVLTRRE